jgi:hypothetical protein
MTCEEWRNHRFAQMVEAGAKIGYNKEHDCLKLPGREKNQFLFIRLIQSQL